MEEKPFFSQLKNFCCGIEADIQSLKQSINEHPSIKPHTYYEGMEMMKKQVMDVKNLSETTKTEIEKLYTFKPRIADLGMKLADQRKFIQQIEDHLIKFGYIPLDISDQIKLDDETEKEPTVVEDQDRKNAVESMTALSFKSPELSYETKLCLAQKCPGSSPMEIQTPDDRTEESLPCEFTPMNSTRKQTVKKWLAGLQEPDAPSAELSPATSHQSTVARNIAPFNGGKLNIGHKIMMETAEISRETPDEPSLSSITLDLLKTDSFCLTPEETLRTSSVNYEEYLTPSSPVIDTHISPLNKHNDSMPRTPQTPQLSDVTKHFLNLCTVKPTKTEDIKLPLKLNEDEENTNSFGNEEPPSPKLSDITMQILKY